MKLKLLRNYLALSLMFFIFSNSISAQSQEPIDMIIINNAPNLTWIQRTTATVNVFKGVKFNYSLVENNQKLNNWVNSYPQEFVAYKNAMDEFFRTKKVENFTPTDQDFYYDLKAQYNMLKTLKPW
ncbi:hypothetical protein KCTC32516_00010 [Polaribacter huanghezhanensis]|uniref:hypothetical protein n=1 Tax=Polaribacter huanghezhanensis TaxID=1354726 RepID=UPI00264768FA|nr:hypothetical protein [Polaribacter huanghezhanensis]WKD84676.1 hypothetical protein KCTC32516_00010 [Polaribacter huanghezhanensis]